MSLQRKSNNAALNRVFVSTSTKSDLPTLKYRRDNDGGTIYHGYAEPGTGTGEAKWMIAEETGTGGNVDFADGNTEFDNVWDDRATLSYS